MAAHRIELRTYCVLSSRHNQLDHATMICDVNSAYSLLNQSVHLVKKLTMSNLGILAPQPNLTLALTFECLPVPSIVLPIAGILLPLCSRVTRK